MARALTCPECAAALADGDEFCIAEVRCDASRSGLVTGFSPDGALTAQALDTEVEPSDNYELTCMSCGHQWPTSRAVDSYWEPL